MQTAANCVRQFVFRARNQQRSYTRVTRWEERKEESGPGALSTRCSFFLRQVAQSDYDTVVLAGVATKSKHHVECIWNIQFN